MEISKLFLLTLFVILTNTYASAQGICVPDTLELNTIRGKVLAHLDAGDEPLRDIILKIARKDNPKKIVKVVKTNGKGKFDFGDVKQGNYSLVAKYTGLSNFYLDLVVTTNDRSKTKRLFIWLGADFLKPCSGSYAELREQ